MSDFEGFLVLLGLAKEQVVLIVLLVVGVQPVGIHVASGLVGLPRSLGRAFLTYLMMVATAAVPVGVLTLLDLPQALHDLLTTGLVVAAGTLAMRVCYRTDFGRALLGYAVGGALASGVTAAIVLAVF